MIRADLSNLDHRYRAKRTGQSPAEYAASIECYRSNSYPRAMWWVMALAAVVVFVTVVLS